MRSRAGSTSAGVVPDRPRKSVGSETTYPEDLGEPAAVEAGVVEMLDDVLAYCERNGIVGRTVTVKIKYADFQIVTRSRSGLEPLVGRPLLKRICIELARSVFPLRKKVRLLGVTLSNLERLDRIAEPQLALEV